MKTFNVGKLRNRVGNMMRWTHRSFKDVYKNIFGVDKRTYDVIKDLYDWIEYCITTERFNILRLNEGVLLLEKSNEELKFKYKLSESKISRLQEQVLQLQSHVCASCVITISHADEVEDDEQGFGEKNAKGQSDKD